MTTPNKVSCTKQSGGAHAHMAIIWLGSSRKVPMGVTKVTGSEVVTGSGNGGAGVIDETDVAALAESGCAEERAAQMRAEAAVAAVAAEARAAEMKKKMECALEELSAAKRMLAEAAERAKEEAALARKAAEEEAELCAAAAAEAEALRMRKELEKDTPPEEVEAAVAASKAAAEAAQGAAANEAAAKAVSLSTSTELAAIRIAGSGSSAAEEHAKAQMAAAVLAFRSALAPARAHLRALAEVTSARASSASGAGAAEAAEAAESAETLPSVSVGAQAEMRAASHVSAIATSFRTAALQTKADLVRRRQEANKRATEGMRRLIMKK